MAEPEKSITGEGVASMGRNAFFLLSGRGLNYLFRFAYMIALAKYLGPDVYGLYKYGMSWYLAFLSAAGMGIGTIMCREIGRDRDRGAAVLSSTMSFQVLVAVGAAVFCGAVGSAVDTNLDVRRIIVVLSVALVGRALARWAEQAFVAHESARTSMALQAIYRPLEVIIGLVLLAFGAGVVAIVILHAVCWWLQALNGLIWVNARLAVLHWGICWRKASGLIAQGLPLGIAAFLFLWLLQGILILYRHVPGAEKSLGQLALAVTLFGLLGGSMMAVTGAALPVLSRSAQRKDRKELIYAELMIKVVITFGTAAALCAAALGPLLVVAIFGPSYEMAGQFLGTVLWLMIPWSCGSVLWGIFLARGNFFWPMLILGLAAAAITVSFFPLVTAWGPLGALMANAAGLIVWAGGFAAVFVVAGELLLGPTVLKPSIPAFLAVCVYYLLHALNAGLALGAALSVLILGTTLLKSLTLRELSIFRNFFKH